MTEIKTDYQAFTVILVSVVLREQPEQSVIAVGGVEFYEDTGGWRSRVYILDLQRSTESWDDVILHAERTLNNPVFSLQAASEEVMLIVDNSTGSTRIGDIVMELEVPSVCTVMSGEAVKRSDGLMMHIPVVDVVEGLIAAYQAGRVEIAETLELAEGLEGSLQRISVKEAREIDALPLAAALLVYYADDCVPMGDADIGVHEYDTANWGLE